MKLLTFKKDLYSSREVWILSGDGHRVIPLFDFGVKYKSINELIVKISYDEMAYINKQLDSKQGMDYKSIIKEAPIPDPMQDIICLGMNYSAHAEEAAKYNSDYEVEKPKPVYFSKRVNYAVPDGGCIDSHKDIVHELDYEVELAIIIGQDARNVRPEDVSRFIFGYSIINDFSARDLQLAHKQWYFGKSLDGFTAFGPWIVTQDEMPDAEKSDIKCYVNGELRQNSNTPLLKYNISHIISELSSGMTLKAGTIIATGTPAGVGFGFNPPRFLKSGDVVKCEIQGIGAIENTVE
ncbi:MAG: fumarylacetoacetate hydrolase family protein [Clostridiaceae bacterium]|nr:fumarylacetoacetate hydrolase family protein [Clostridiaceae bacterium]